MRKKPMMALLIVFLIASAACVGVDETNATATAEAGGTDRQFLADNATATAEADGFDDRILVFDATATAEAGGSDDRLRNAYATATAEAIIDEATSVAYDLVYDATSTAIAIEDEEEAAKAAPESGERQALTRASKIEISTPTPVPATATPVPVVVPTATQVPVPTATEIPLTIGLWLTALQAIEIASQAQPGIVKYISGHVSPRAGRGDYGDVTSNTPSPGAGYSSSWEVMFVDGGKDYLCVVQAATADCGPGFGFIDPGDITGADIDSLAVFETWRDNAEWNELLANDDISTLMILEPDAGEGTPLVWRVYITVRGESNGLSGGSFFWTPATNFTKSIPY